MSVTASASNHNQHSAEKRRNMAATPTPAATHDCSSKPTVRRWNRYSTPTSFTQATPASKARPDTTQVLWSKLLIRLEEEQLGLDDLPTTEEPLWGMLYELGFTSYLERGKLCKQIRPGKLTPSTKHSPDNSTRITPADNTITNTTGLLSHPGQRGLDAACRSAYKMAISACQTIQDTTLWLQMPPTVTNTSART